MYDSLEGSEAGAALLQRERREQNPTLRRLVNGLLDHVRELSHGVDRLSPVELEEEHQRFNLIAELMWATITDEKNKSER
jgi:hypothetical protein